eukprot:TRINITY_DN27859_c0_g1_i3.p1 TRINITY_DN27859_c0_g1~~TRINITY_DN27859_c0_g1_i3.p1  ORF type:complete len:378 (+),score=54.43 TRINITY_DN27859_c0_g1_i3:94-1227(+)
MIRRPPRSTLSSSSAASDVYKRQQLQAIKAQLFELESVPPTPQLHRGALSPEALASKLAERLEEQSAQSVGPGGRPGENYFRAWSSCPRVPMPKGPAEFEAIIRAGRPVILRDATAAFEIAHWDERHLRDAFGMQMLLTMFGAEGDRYNIKASGSTLERPYEQQMRLRSAMDAMDMPRGRSVTVAQASIVGASEMMEQMATPEFLQGLDQDDVNLWMTKLSSNQSKQSGLHFDAAENILLQVRGQKRVELYSPLLSARVAPGPLIRTLRTSKGDLKIERSAQDGKPVVATQFSTRRTDLLRHSPTVCELRAGDALYIPSFAWHDVASFGEGRAEGFNIAVNLWVSPNRALAEYHALVHGMLLDGHVALKARAAVAGS